MTTPTTPTTSHLASLSAALESVTDRESLAHVFSEVADEALTLVDKARTPELRQFWLDLHEDFHGEAQLLQAPVKPKRRWFR